PFRPLQSLAQLLEGNARSIGGENCPLSHFRLDAGVNLLLEIELFRHRLDNEVGRRYAFAAEVRDQPVERIAYPAAIVATDLAVEVSSALDCAGQGLGLHVGKTDGKSVPRTPGGDIATHR